MEEHSFNFLESVSKARSKHGLRVSDYARYRKFCGRKVSKLRKLLTMSCVPNLHFTSWLEKQESSLDVYKCIELLMFLCEKHWSQAMELKQHQDSDPDNLRKAHHISRKLKRATFYAHLMDQLCQETSLFQEACSPLVKRHIQAYYKMVHAQYLFQVQQWKDALEHFEEAEALHTELMHKGNIYTEVVCASMIDSFQPNIRYCQYKMGLPPNQFSSDNLAETLGQHGARMTIFGQEVIIKSKSTLKRLEELREKIKNAETAFPLGSRRHKFEILIKESARIYSSLVKDIERYQAQGVYVDSTHPHPSLTNLIHIQDCFLAIHVSVLVLRNVNLIEIIKEKYQRFPYHPKALKSIIHKYSAIIKRLSGLLEMDTFKYNNKFSTYLENRVKYYKASSLFLLSKMSTDQKAILCIQQALDFIHSIQNADNEASMGFDHFPPLSLPSEMKKLKLQLENGLHRFEATKILEADEQQAQPCAIIFHDNRDHSPSLLERPDAFHIWNENSANIVNFETKLKPVPVKGIFFDIAYNYISFNQEVAPPEADPMTLGKSKNAEMKSEQKKQGFFGSWFG